VAKSTDEPKDVKAATTHGSDTPASNATSKDASPSPASGTQPDTVTASEAEALIALVSTPAGADVNVDDAFVGNAPASLKLKPGKHTIKITMAGYKDWSREMTVLAGSQVSLTATMEKSN
jgi:hypothetical protein